MTIQHIVGVDRWWHARRAADAVLNAEAVPVEAARQLNSALGGLKSRIRGVNSEPAFSRRARETEVHVNPNLGPREFISD